MSATKTARWLDLIAFLLQHRFPVTRETIFRHVAGYGGAGETARRKFERDKDDLRSLGIEIESVTLPESAGGEPAVGYRLRARGTYLPYLELVDAQEPHRPYPGLDQIVLTRAELLVLDRATRSLADQPDAPLAHAARSARRKLAFDLPLEPETVERILAHPLPAHARHALALLQEALIERVAVSCRYYTLSRGVEEPRTLEPWGLLFQWSRWYCVGRARDREEARLFRVDRMRDARKVTGPDAHFEVPADFDIRQVAGRSPWEFGNAPPRAATVEFQFPESRWVINRRVGRVVRDDGDRGAQLAFLVRDPDSFLRWLLSFGSRARVIDPIELANSLASLRSEVASLYADSAP